MKKVIALLIAILMMAALVACGNGGKTDTPASTPPASNTPAPPASTPPPVVDKNFEIPYVDFGYKPASDPFAREKYQFAHIIMMHSPFSQLMVDMYSYMGTLLNYEITSYSSYRDADGFMNFIEMQAGQGVDGMIIEGDFTLQDRIFELTDEYNIIFMPGLSPLITAEGKYLRPSAVMDSYKMGWGCMEYMLDNYQNYTGKSFNADKMGFITLEFGIITDFNTRRDGAVDAYKARYPQLLKTNYFNLDTSPEPNPMAAEAAYTYVSSLIAANPDFEGWLVFGVAEDFGDGASRALEDFGYGNTSLVTTVAVTMLTEKWKTGYEGCWIGGADTPPIQWAHAVVSGLFLLLDGKETPDTLWKQYREPGQDVTVIKLPYTIVNRSMYKDYLAAVDRYMANVFAK